MTGLVSHQTRVRVLYSGTPWSCTKVTATFLCGQGEKPQQLCSVRARELVVKVSRVIILCIRFQPGFEVAHALIVHVLKEGSRLTE